MMRKEKRKKKWETIRDSIQHTKREKKKKVVQKKKKKEEGTQNHFLHVRLFTLKE